MDLPRQVFEDRHSGVHVADFVDVYGDHGDIVLEERLTPALSISCEMERVPISTQVKIVSSFTAKVHFVVLHTFICKAPSLFSKKMERAGVRRFPRISRPFDEKDNLNDT